MIYELNINKSWVAKIMIEKIFSNMDYSIPIEFKSNDFKNEIKNLLTAYIKELENFDVSQKVIERLKGFRRSCLYVLSNYLKGIHSNAFKNFERALAAIQISDSPLLSTHLGADILF